MPDSVVGEIRQSQVLWTYGPGALIDLPNMSVMPTGIDRWEVERCDPIDEPRLLAKVKEILGPNVKHLRKPPVSDSDNVDLFSAEGRVGMSVRPFPRFMRCVRCGYLAEREDDQLFELKPDRFRPERTKFIHRGCDRALKLKTPSEAVPARFLLACRNGHLDDFPWRWYVHDGPSECSQPMYFFESNASLQTENLKVKCDCGRSKSLAHAFGEQSVQHLPRCRGRHAHLDHFEEGCEERPRTVILGASNSWFPMSVSTLALPPLGDALNKYLEDGWDHFQDVDDKTELKGILKTLKKMNFLTGIERFSQDEIWDGIVEKRNGGTATVLNEQIDVKVPEWVVLTHPDPPTDWPHFLSEKAHIPSGLSGIFDEVLLLKRMREVNALIGFTRVEAPEETDDPDERPPMAPLTRGSPEWVPVSEVHGEGIFVKFNENRLKTWEASRPVETRRALLEQGHRAWRSARNLNPDVGMPLMRYIMMHSFAHLIIRELALECGYNSASIRERIYASDDSSMPMAGILIYTAAADSDGTLGGLVELGEPNNFGPIIHKALQRATVCSSDPICSEHRALQDRSLHLAACHSCTFVSETSCERMNRYLDRALLVPTFDVGDAAYFKELVEHV